MLRAAIATLALLSVVHAAPKVLPSGCVSAILVPADATTCTAISDLADPAVSAADVDAMNPAVSCDTPLQAGTVVCAGDTPDTPLADPSTLNVPGLSPEQKELLSASADYSAIAMEGQAPISQTTFEGKKGFKMTISQKSEAVRTAAGHSGHAALRNWVEGTSGTALVVTFVPNWYTVPNNGDAVFTTEVNSKKSRRSLLNGGGYWYNYYRGRG